MECRFKCKDIVCPNCNSELELDEIDIHFNLKNKISNKNKWYGAAMFRCVKCNSVVALRGTCEVKE